jgi:spore germination protein YaaH
MKKVCALIIFIVLLLGVVWVRGFHAVRITPVNKEVDKVQSISKRDAPVSTISSIFVPYWTISSPEDLSNYDQLYYFGVEASSEGINTSEQGYKAIDQFMAKVMPGQQKFLVVRMVDKDLNSRVVKDTDMQQKIVSQAIKIAQSNNFDGIVLDFETSSISFTSTTNRITSLYERFSHAVKNSDLAFYVTLYGDTFYRVRAYDVKKIAGLADKVLVMTYDFHKAAGGPGPDFPLSGKKIYGYDLTKMADDFLNDVPPAKISIIYGMFGYDWQVDRDGKTVGIADSQSLDQMTSSFITSCSYSDCVWKRDDTSSEMKVTYKDEDGNKHVVWFEDTDSVKKKIEYLKSRDVMSSGYWAYGYF